MKRHLGTRLAYWWDGLFSWAFVIDPVYRGEGYEVTGRFGMDLSMPCFRSLHDARLSIHIGESWRWSRAWNWPWSKLGRAERDRRHWAWERGFDIR